MESDSCFHVTLYHSAGREYVSMHHILELLLSKVRKKGKIRLDTTKNHNLIQDTILESDKTQESITQESQGVSPFPAGDHKTARNRHDSITKKNTNNTNNKNDPQKKHRL